MSGPIHPRGHLPYTCQQIPLGPTQNLYLSWHQGVEIAQRTSPDFTSPASSCGLWKWEPLTPVFLLRSRMRDCWPLSELFLLSLGPWSCH